MAIMEKALDRITAQLSKIGDIPDIPTLLETPANKDAEDGPFEELAIPSFYAASAYIDWSRMRVYATGLTATAAPGHRKDILSARHAAIDQARRRLMQEIMGIRVDANNLFGDLAKDSRLLPQLLEFLLEALEANAHDRLENGKQWALVRFPLNGPDGLMPLILPFRTAQANPSGVQEQRPSRAVPPPMNEHPTGIVLDARQVSIDPVLLPQIRTPSDRLVIDASSLDPNVIVQQGFSLYTPYEGSIPHHAGERPLWLTVIRQRRPGILIVADDEGDKLLALPAAEAINTLPLVILTDSVFH